MSKFSNVLISEDLKFSRIQIGEIFSVFPRMVTRSWIITTILVVAAMAIMIRLGIWQLDRLEGRRLFNSHLLMQQSQPVLNLNTWSGDENINEMEYRGISVVGIYDHSQEIALRNQHWQNLSGVHLVTPLKISGTEGAVLVDRGWISSGDYDIGDWSAFAEDGEVEVNGVIRKSISKADFGNKSDPRQGSKNNPVKTWNFVTVDRIQAQVSMPLVPIYIQQSPDPSWTNLPYRSQPKLDITEGPHMGYAIQWFTFAAILGLGYPVFIRRQTKNNTE